ncbi:PREDICTED: signaling lymphocytic activation molecule-like [Apaloderma vittatum]|uniref:signaling lymphocytic activation molecule-like n=1 Tax=Apaloderma vittatum TaxID=57397 RepID=UPI0005216787|nr:PREDICTED: signaling lymphocytic activation molecule-like [Apaloderma vittatum]
MAMAQRSAVLLFLFVTRGWAHQSPLEVVGALHGVAYLSPSQQENITYHQVHWRRNHTLKIASRDSEKILTYPSAAYKGRLELFPNNTLKISSLGKNDSNLYQVYLENDRGEEHVEDIHLTVYDLVPKPMVEANVTKSPLPVEAGVSRWGITSAPSAQTYICKVSNPVSSNNASLSYRPPCSWTGMDRGVRETVLGTLGKVTRLRIPSELQDLTRRFGAASWKRSTEDPESKQVLLRYSDGNYTSYMQEQIHFNKSDFSLEILNTSRQDRQLYEDILQPVSDPSVEILSRVLANGSCTLTLNCTAERGDNVSYSWESRDAGTPGLCSRKGSLLHLSYPLQNASIACACTASNPVSSRVVAFTSSQCSYEQGGSAGLRMEHLVLLVVVPIAAVMLLALLFVVARLAKSVAGQQQEGSTLAGDNAVHTIYSQVQRVERKRGPAAEPPSCTTIYAAATGPPCSSPAEPPAPWGHSSLTQGRVVLEMAMGPPACKSSDTEPMTVYASVMMPVA